jgi:pimeloyl-ACP methyl ester carboxylesterase
VSGLGQSQPIIFGVSMGGALHWSFYRTHRRLRPSLCLSRPLGRQRKKNS